MKKKIPKTRNPFVQHFVNKKQGAHRKSYKAQRGLEKIKLKQELKT